MDMTAPVLVKIPEETKMWEPAVYTLNFLMPSAYQDKPPVPTNNKLYFTEMPEMDVYVRGYGGWMLSVTSRLHAHLLTKELERVRASYNYNYHYGVGYDSPLKLLNRHNEVWYVAQGEPVCTDPTEPTAPHPVRLLQSEQPADTFPDLPSDPPSDPPSQQPDVPSPAADNETTSNSSHTRPTSLSPSQASSSPLSHQPTDAALSQAPTSVHTALEQTSSLSDPSFPVSPPVDAQGNSTKTEPADLPHDAQ